MCENWILPYKVINYYFCVVFICLPLLYCKSSHTYYVFAMILIWKIFITFVFKYFTWLQRCTNLNFSFSIKIQIPQLWVHVPVWINICRSQCWNSNPISRKKCWPFPFLEKCSISTFQMLQINVSNVHWISFQKYVDC